MTSAMSNAIYDEYEGYVIQYKKEYGSNVVVLLQVGSFYEIYDADDGLVDIKTISEIMNITLTRKNKNVLSISKSNCNMSGFPAYTLSKYTNILLQNNYTVVVVSQITDPPKPKRGVTAIYSPGTKIDELTTYENNYLMSLYIDENQDLKTGQYTLNIGVSYIDVSTGSSYVFETGSKPEDKHYALDETYRIIVATNPKEILILGKVKTMNVDDILCHLEIEKRCVQNRLNRDTLYENISFQNQLLTKLFPDHGLISPIEYIELERQPYALVSYVSLLDFAYKHSEQIITKIKKPNVVLDENHLNLSYNTAKQLNVVSSDFCNSSLVSILNTCKTAIGKRRFLNRILNPRIDIDSLNKDYDNIAYFQDEERYKSARDILGKIYDVERQFRRILLNRLNPCEIVSMITSIENVRTLLSFEVDSSLTEDGIQSILHHFQVINNEEVMKYNIDNITGNIFKIGTYKDLDLLCDTIHACTEFFHKLSTELNFQISEKYFKLEKNEKDGFYITVTTKRFENFKKTAQNFKIDDVCIDVRKLDGKKISSSSNSVKLSHPCMDEINIILENTLIKLKNSVTQKYYDFMKSCCKYNDTFNKIIEYIGLIDYNCTNAYNAIEFAYCRPYIDNKQNGKSFVNAVSLRHPIIERIQTTTVYIPNDISLGLVEDGMLLYGLNASGKSSLMKSLGLSIIMACAGMYVPSSSFVFFPYKHIFTRIPTGDNISKGQSTFTNEISELRKILKRANSNSLVIGDELASGTENISAMSIISAGIITLCDRRSSFIFATHLHDLVKIERIKNIRNMKIYHLSVMFDDTNSKLIYDRKLKLGPGKTLYGLEVCRALDIDKNFLKLADQIRREILGIDDSIISHKKKKYNSGLFGDVCGICGERASEVHHIREQRFADQNGIIDHFHKNTLHNLLNICVSCHDKIHNKTILIEGYKTTSKGVELMYRVNDNYEIC